MPCLGVYTAQVRLTEVILFLVPFAAFIAWRLTLGGGGPTRAMLIAAACALTLLAGALVLLSEDRALPPGSAYVPAELHDGGIVPGHAAAR
jgi:Family of unknown function (DUF6111)